MSAVNWLVNAFVDATPISGPALVRIVPAASRVIIEPATLQMAIVFELFWADSRAHRCPSSGPPREKVRRDHHRQEIEYRACGREWPGHHSRRSIHSDQAR